MKKLILFTAFIGVFVGLANAKKLTPEEKQKIFLQKRGIMVQEFYNIKQGLLKFKACADEATNYKEFNKCENILEAYSGIKPIPLKSNKNFNLVKSKLDEVIDSKVHQIDGITVCLNGAATPSQAMACLGL
ncbi:MAG TPA: hypothetical protein ENO30_05500 [Thermodesulfobium narugense]|nr:hypothetical protein [Thermodesulfobium narugense]